MAESLSGAARRTISMICESAQGAAQVFPRSLSVKAQNELEKACRQAQTKLTMKSGQLGRQAHDGEAILNGEFARVSKETWKELAELAAEFGGTRSGAGPSLPSNSDAPEPAGPRDISYLTKGQGKQVRIPVQGGGGKAIHLLLNYTGSPLSGTAQLSGVGAGTTYKAQDAEFGAAVLYEPSTGNLGAQAVIRIEF